MILKKEEVLNYLKWAKEVHEGHSIMDLHVSPLEVIFNSFEYLPNPTIKDVFSLDDSDYNPPEPGPVRLEASTFGSVSNLHKETANRLSSFIYKKNFAHIGSRVLGDQMKLCGINKCLLLPVTHPGDDGEQSMKLISRVYGADDRFLRGYCVPSTVTNDGILDNIIKAVALYDIRAIKVHPNITGIDLSHKNGKLRVEAILRASRIAKLPLVIHGGISPVINDTAMGKHAHLKNLVNVDWGITDNPVVISHAGMMAASPGDAEKFLIPLIKRILNLYEHVFVDISALEYSVLKLVLSHISHERIVFGSDFYYFPQWGAMAKLIHALKALSSDIEERYLRIVAHNPDFILNFREGGDRG